MSGRAGIGKPNWAASTFAKTSRPPYSAKRRVISGPSPYVAVKAGGYERVETTFSAPVAPRAQSPQPSSALAAIWPTWSFRVPNRGNGRRQRPPKPPAPSRTAGRRRKSHGLHVSSGASGSGARSFQGIGNLSNRLSIKSTSALIASRSSGPTVSTEIVLPEPTASIMTATTLRASAVRPPNASDTRHRNLETSCTIMTDGRAWMPNGLVTLTSRFCIAGGYPTYAARHEGCRAHRPQLSTAAIHAPSRVRSRFSLDVEFAMEAIVARRHVKRR
jgi:hypothetical protein